MAERKRKPVDKNMPAFKMTRMPDEAAGTDLKQEKERIKKELEQNEENKKEWYDNELSKNMKNIK